MALIVSYAAMVDVPFTCDSCNGIDFVRVLLDHDGRPFAVVVILVSTIISFIRCTNDLILSTLFQLTFVLVDSYLLDYLAKLLLY